MLAAMEPLQPASTSTDDYAHVISHDVTVYLSPLRLTDEEKLSPLIFWKNHADVYPNLAMLARLYLTPCASSVFSACLRVCFRSLAFKSKTAVGLPLRHTDWINRASRTTIRRMASSSSVNWFSLCSLIIGLTCLAVTRQCINLL